MSENNQSETTHKKFSALDILAAAVAVGAILLFVGIALGERLGERLVRREAIRAKHATWEVNPDNGDPVFTWVPNHK
jgi:hypothetical protein